MSDFFKERFRGFYPVVIDVETGGFNPNTDALLEIAAVTLVPSHRGELTIGPSFFYPVEPYPNSNIEGSALEFTGIKLDSAFRDAFEEKDAINQLFQNIRPYIKSYQCSRAIIVGHNTHFDHQFMKAAISRNQIKRDPFHQFSTLDTASLGALAYGHTVLAQCCKLAGIEFLSQEAHSALYDATKTAELFCKIFNTWHTLGGWPPPSASPQ